MSQNKVQYIHLKLRLKGSKQQLETFHRVMEEIDIAYPFKLNPSYTRTACQWCGGMGWWTPNVSATDMKALGRQLGLRKVVVEHWAPEGVCLRKNRYGRD